METIGYILLIIVAVAIFVAMIVGFIAAYPVGLIGLVAVAGIGFLFAKVVKERVANQEDQHYSETIDK